MGFEQQHQLFVDQHANRRTGERRGRLLRGHGHGEALFLKNVWWPLFGSFMDLHPEFEVYDWNRKSQFLDFAYLPSYGKFGIECDGFQSHVRDMDREKFSYSLNRDVFLTGLGWKMIHFSFDDIRDRPEICGMLLQSVIGPCRIRSLKRAVLLEKEVLRLAWSLGRPMRPIDVCSHLDADYRTAKKWLCSLVEKGWLREIGSSGRVRYYEAKPASVGELW